MCMYVCVRVCMYACMYVQTYVHLYVCRHVYMCAHVHIRVYGIRVCTEWMFYLSVCIYILHMFVSVGVCVCVVSLCVRLVITGEIFGGVGCHLGLSRAPVRVSIAPVDQGFLIGCRKNDDTLMPGTLQLHVNPDHRGSVVQDGAAPPEPTSQSQILPLSSLSLSLEMSCFL